MSYQNKRILFMGDSITALGGWVARFNEWIKPSCFVNIAVSGAHWQDYPNTVYDGEPVLNGPDQNVNNTICNQLEIVLRKKDRAHTPYHYDPAYDAFDVIIVSAGTNDSEMQGLFQDQDAVIDSQFVYANGAPLPFKKIDRKTLPGAMRAVYEELHRLYPQADIFYCTPIQAAEEIRPYASIRAKGAYMKAICDRISDIHLIDTFQCGICGIYEKRHQNGRDLIDGLHPNENGEIKISKYNAAAIKQYFMSLA